MCCGKYAGVKDDLGLGWTNHSILGYQMVSKYKFRWKDISIMERATKSQNKVKLL